MKTKAFLIIFLLLSFITQAQEKQDSTYNFAKKGFTVSHGINSHLGILGISWYVATSPHFITDIGVGVSGWGYRFSLSEQFYPDRTNNLFLRGAIFYSQGIFIDNILVELDDNTSSTQMIHKKPIVNLNLTVGKSFVFFNKHRLNIEGGYSYIHKAKTDAFEIQNNNLKLSEDYKNSLSVPKGITISISFAFGI